MTRRVSGLSGEAIARASSSRPLPSVKWLPVAAGQNEQELPRHWLAGAGRVAANQHPRLAGLGLSTSTIARGGAAGDLAWYDSTFFFSSPYLLSVRPVQIALRCRPAAHRSGRPCPAESRRVAGDLPAASPGPRHSRPPAARLRSLGQQLAVNSRHIHPRLRHIGGKRGFHQWIALAGAHAHGQSLPAGQHRGRFLGELVGRHLQQIVPEAQRGMVGLGMLGRDTAASDRSSWAADPWDRATRTAAWRAASSARRRRRGPGNRPIAGGSGRGRLRGGRQ